jgi:SulP family sulfate permease
VLPSSLRFPRPAQWARLFPPTRWWGRVNRLSLRDDLLAGLTGAIVVLPQGVAFATIAGMPPAYGLYAGMIPAIVAAIFGSSWHLVSGPTTAASIVLFSVLSSHAEPGSAQYVQLALTLTFMVGIVQLGMGLARLGTLVNFISHSVVIGFTSGAAILIATNQLKNFFGIAVPRGSGFVETLHTLFTHLGAIDSQVLAVSAATLAIGIAVRKLWPRVPYMIVAMLGGSVLAWILTHFGGATTIGTVGALPATLPPVSAPDLSLETLRKLAPGVVAVTLLALTEAVSIARALAVRSGQTIDGNQEFIGQGLSNLAGSFFSAYVATGSFNRSGLNYDAGARTPLSSIMSGVLLMAIMLLVAPLAAYLPNAAMAGILFLVAWGLLDFHHIFQIIRTSRAETVILLTTFFSTLFLELETAITLGVMLSLGIYLSRTSRPNILARVPDPQTPRRKFADAGQHLPECPQLRFVRLDGSLFFAAVSYVQEKLVKGWGAGNQKHLAVVATGINFIDIAGAEFLVNEARKRRAQGGGLYFIRAKDVVTDLLQRGGYMAELGPENFFHSKTEAIHSVFERMDKRICAHCPHHVFRECASVQKTAAAPAPQDPGPMPMAAARN